MMCVKDMIADAKTKIEESKNIVLHRSVDVKFSLAKKGELGTPIKSVCLHRNCTTPLWKVMLIALGVISTVMMLGSVMKKTKKCPAEEESL